MLVYIETQIELISENKLAAKAVAGISVLTLKWLSCQGVPLVGSPLCS